MPRKRRHASKHQSSAKKRRHTSNETTSSQSSFANVPVLHHLYDRVITLQAYLLDALPKSSRSRRRRIQQINATGSGVSTFLTSTLVGLSKSSVRPSPHVGGHGYVQDLRAFVQSQRSLRLQSVGTEHVSCTEIVEFVVWSLFQRNSLGARTPNHVLCHGLERVTSNNLHQEPCRSFIPGIIQRRQNAALAFCTLPVWTQAAALVGKDADLIFSRLFFDHAIFAPDGETTDRYFQVSGTPFHELCRPYSSNRSDVAQRCVEGETQAPKNAVTRTLSQISLVRSRTLYSKPSFNRQGDIQFGLRHMHIFNRASTLSPHNRARILIAYMFPRQCKLHNVFTSTIDRRQTAQQFKDYTFREDELRTRCGTREAPVVPRRLRGSILELVNMLYRNHRTCSYQQLLNHFCPTPGLQSLKIIGNLPLKNKSSGLKPSPATQMTKLGASKPTSTSPSPSEDLESSLLPYTTNPSQVSAFVRAVIRRIIPCSVFSADINCSANWDTFMEKVDRLISLRRFETMSLHEILRGLKVTSMAWLASAGCGPLHKASLHEQRKREELLHELLYFIFDSLVIPLINTNFYVTETGVFRNRLVYFRHDVWQRLSKPYLTSAAAKSLATVNSHVLACLGNNPFEPSTRRLLPKEVGTRVITNLRRRALRMVGERPVLGMSTNARLSPVFDIFNHERQRNSAIYNIDDANVQSIQRRLSSFKSESQIKSGQPVFFVKVDIQSAFDSIPQEQLLEVVRGIFRHSQYVVYKQAESKIQTSLPSAQPQVRFRKVAVPSDIGTLKSANYKAGPAAGGGTVVNEVDGAQLLTRKQALHLLEQHIQNNLVRVGNKVYRQTVGIPQGSVLSSMLCTFFYNQFEASRLRFLNNEKTLLLRVMDDFLLVTTDCTQATQFVTAMKAGDEDFGIMINPSKSLVNFYMTIDGVQLPCITPGGYMPFCGLLIDTAHLEVRKDRFRGDNVVSNTLTVKADGRLGHALWRRISASLRIQLQSILLDKTLNSTRRITQTLMECFLETAMKLHQYLANIPAKHRPSQQFLIRLVQRLITLVRRMEVKGSQGTIQTFTTTQISCLASASFIRVLSTRSAGYPGVLAWLRRMYSASRHTLPLDGRESRSLVGAAFEAVHHYIY